MSRLFPALVIATVGLCGAAATCRTPAPEIAAERAIAIAQSHVTFEAVSVDAEKATEDGRRIWRVTFRGRPMSPEHPLLRPIMIVLIDPLTGEVISVAKS